MLRFRCLALLALLALLPTVTPAGQDNVVQNGDFESGESPWLFFTDQPLDSAFDVVGGAARFEVWPTQNTQLYQAPLSLRGDTEYELSFFASSDYAASKRLESTRLQPRAVKSQAVSAPEGSLRVAIAQHGAPYANYGLLRQVNLNAGLRQFVYRFTTPPGDVTDARLRFMFHVTQSTFDYVIDDVVLRAVNCGNGTLDTGEECDDGNAVAGDGCDDACSVECQVSYGRIDPAAATLSLLGRSICTLDGPAQSDPAVFFGDATGGLAPLPLLGNGPSFIEADLSGYAPLDAGTHKVIVICPGAGKEIDVSVGTSARTVSAAVACSDAMLCSVTATCPSGDVLAGTWSFDGNLAAVEGGVTTAYAANAYTVTLQGSAGFDGATLEAQVRCAP